MNFFYDDNCHGAYLFISLKNKHQKVDLVSSHTTDRRSSNSESSDTEGHLSDEFHINLPVDIASSNAGVRSPVTTRQTVEVCNNIEGLSTAFPEIKVRTSRKLINEKVIRCATQCLADYKVSQRDLSGIIVHIAIAKLLSPSHAAHSISLYSDYKTWIESEVKKDLKVSQPIDLGE